MRVLSQREQRVLLMLQERGVYAILIFEKYQPSHTKALQNSGIF